MVLVVVPWLISTTLTGILAGLVELLAAGVVVAVGVALVVALAFGVPLAVTLALAVPVAVAFAPEVPLACAVVVAAGGTGLAVLLDVVVCAVGLLVSGNLLRVCLISLT